MLHPFKWKCRYDLGKDFCPSFLQTNAHPQFGKYVLLVTLVHKTYKYRSSFSADQMFEIIKEKLQDT